MTKNKKILIVIPAFATIAILFYYLVWSFAPGSYERAETYEFDIPENQLISVIQEFKDENPAFDLKQKVNVDNGYSFFMEEGRRDSSDHWFSIYFYYPHKNQIIKTWTRPSSKTKTTFAFVSVNDGLTLGNWTDVNKSFLWWENTPIKLEFEEKILNKIKAKIDK